MSGSAFPYSFTTLFGEDVYDSGMTLRDWFAGMAVSGRPHGWSAEEVARHAYEIADAMIEQRKQS